MFERLQKPFLTTETGEGFQPIRITYLLNDKDRLIATLEKLSCITKNNVPNSWSWYWKGECDGIPFDSVDSFRKNPQNPIRLGTITLRDNYLYFNLPSFKRACLAIPFFHRVFEQNVANVHHADFINKVFGTDERLPHGFTELFKEEELDRHLEERVMDYHKVKEQCEHAKTAEEAFVLLSNYTKKEAQKRLPYAERYVFDTKTQDADVIFLAFYVFLQGREIVAIKRWFGQAGYTLANAIDETIEQVFGNLGIDIIE